MINIRQITNKNKFFNLEIKDLIIKKGQRLAILGKNGAGKTTFIETFLKLRKAQVYSVEWSEEFKINGVFQQLDFEYKFTVKEIIKWWAYLLNIKNFDLLTMAHQFELESLLNQKYFMLSMGQKQKVKICVSLLNNPNLLVFDELSSALDIVWQQKIMQLLNDYFLKNPTCILLFITHNLEEASFLCNSGILIENGRIKKHYSSLKDLANLKNDWKEN